MFFLKKLFIGVHSIQNEHDFCVNVAGAVGQSFQVQILQDTVAAVVKENRTLLHEGLPISSARDSLQCRNAFKCIQFFGFEFGLQF